MARLVRGLGRVPRTAGRATHPRTNRRLPESVFGMRRIVVGPVLALLGITALAFVPGVASASGSKFGVATGKAIACSGPAFEPVAHLSVYREDSLIRSLSLPQGDTFRFMLKPGVYVISNQGHPGRYVGSPPFRVRSGRTTHVTVRNFCR